MSIHISPIYISIYLSIYLSYIYLICAKGEEQYIVVWDLHSLQLFKLITEFVDSLIIGKKVYNFFKILMEMHAV